MYGRRSISNRLSRYVVLLSAGLLLVITLLVGAFSRSIIERGTISLASRELEVVTSDVERVVSEVERAVDNVDWFVQQHRSEEPLMYQATRELVEANPNIIGSAVAFAPGYFHGRHWFAPYTYIDAHTNRIQSIQMGNESYDYPNLDWYRIPMTQGRAVWSEPYFDEGGGNPRMATYSAPMRDESGNLFAVLTSDISLEWLSQRMAESTLFNGSYAVMISERGMYIAHPDSSKILNQSIFDVASAMPDTMGLAIARNMVTGMKGTGRFIDVNGLDSFAVYGPLSNGWSIMLVSPYILTFSNLYIFNIILIVLLLFGLIAMYFGCRRLIRRQTMPIVEFSNAAMTMAKGNFNAHIPEVNTRDELMTLRNSIEYMQRSLNEYITELKATTAANERFESELNIARGIQNAMLPQDFPADERFDLHAMVQPAKEVGGDLYDFVLVGDVLFFMVGDVSGKGVPASIYMAIVRAAFRFIGSLGMPIQDVVRQVNNCLNDGNKNCLFVTFFAGCLHLSTGELEFCNAGHNPIVQVKPDGSASFLRAKPNLAAGLIRDFPYEGEVLHLEPGSRLVLYSDGVTEAECADKTQFGEDRLLEWAGHLLPGVSASAATLDLYSRVKSFTQGSEQNDDITILSLQYGKQ